MVKCSVRDCANKVIGGFQKTIAVGHFQDPNAAIPGMRTLWCEEHESSLNRGHGNGRYLSAAELKQEQP
jgi:hypothetical protein